jgi:Holliday junction resolvase RusA-like endonuclease
MTITIPGSLPSLNEYINAERTNRYIAATMKRQATERVYWHSRNYKGTSIAVPVHITFTWYMKDRRKDLDNCAFAKKFVLDGMVKASVLVSDSQKYVSGFTDEFRIDKNERVEVSL